MGKHRRNKQAGLATKVALAASVLVLVPSAGLALDGLGTDSSLRELSGFASFTPATMDPDMARLIAARGRNDSGMTRFTPAGMSGRTNRSMTVAVRVDENDARAYSVRSAIQAANDRLGRGSRLPISPTRYNLGMSRGYQNFAKPPEVAGKLADIDIPDLAEFRPSPVRDEPSRFAARIDLKEENKAGAAPRTIEGKGDQSVDVAGSYRLTRNLDVTAGVRYSQDRDRIAPITDPARNDSQAVYIGTQFRF